MEEETSPNKAEGQSTSSQSEPVPESVQIIEPEAKSPKSPSTRWNVTLTSLNQKLALFISILIKIGGILLVALLVLLFWQQLTYKGYSLQEVNVPLAFETNGYTGAVLATKIEVNLSKAKHLVKRDPLHLDMKLGDIDIAEYAVQDKGSEFELSMAGVGLPIRSFINLVGNSLGLTQSKRVSAYITTSGGKSILQLNIAGKLSEAIELNLDSLGMEATANQIASNACEYILKISNPELLAQYLLLTDHDQDEIIQACQYAIDENIDSTRNKYVYYTWGLTLWKNKKRMEATEKLTHAIALDQKWVSPYIALNMLYLATGQTEKAKAIIQKAVPLTHEKESDKNLIEPTHFMFIKTMMQYFMARHQYDSAYTYSREYLRIRQAGKDKTEISDGFNNVAFLLSESGRYDSALWYAQKAVSADSSYAVTYTTLAEIYGYQKDEEKFYFYLEKAFKKGSAAAETPDSIAPYSFYRTDERFKKLLKKYK